MYINELSISTDVKGRLLPLGYYRLFVGKSVVKGMYPFLFSRLSAASICTQVSLDLLRGGDKILRHNVLYKLSYLMLYFSFMVKAGRLRSQPSKP